MAEKEMSPDRKKQVETTRLRHGNDYYTKISDMSKSKSRFKNSENARIAAWKRWHPEWFNEAGELIKTEVPSEAS